MQIPKYAPDKTTGKKKDVYYVHIPVTKGINGALMPERARPVKTQAGAFYYPRETINEFIYELANNKKMNQNALYATKEECEEACDKINEELALAQAAKLKPTKKKLAEAPQTTDSTESIATP